jgi:amidohydrolase
LNIDIDQLIRLRHWLHAHPKVSRNEVATARHLRQFLNEHAPPDGVIPLHGAGFAAVYEGQSPGKTVLFRCELDALPIHEINEIPYSSNVDGVSHKCGHDGHMTILAGLAQNLRTRPEQGRAVLLFQPDEETGTGAKMCVTHPNFAKIKPDMVFALHNLPGFPAGRVLCKPGAFASDVKYVSISMSGKEAHSAQPETGKSPATALAELTLKAREIQARYDQPEAYALAVPVFNQMGVMASGISPAQGEVQLTLRSAEHATVEKMWQDLQAFATQLANRDGLKVSFDIREAFPGTANTQTGFDIVRQAAAKTGRAFGQLDLPFRWGEDFGELTKRYDGAMFGLGAGEHLPDLHNPDYDFPDEILSSGIEMFAAIMGLASK